MSVIQNFKERVRSPVFNTAVKTFATNPITLTTLQPEGEFAKLESRTARRHLLPAASTHRDCDEGATSTLVVELLDTVTNFLTHNPTARVVCGMDADDPARQLFAGKLLCLKATS